MLNNINIQIPKFVLKTKQFESKPLLNQNKLIKDTLVNSNLLLNMNSNKYQDLEENRLTSNFRRQSVTVDINEEEIMLKTTSDQSSNQNNNYNNN